MMLPKKKRLTTSEFSRFFSLGKRIHGTYIQLIYTPSPTFHGAAVVGKKVFKKAVDRNKLRRRMYAALYQKHKTENLTGVYILVAKPQAVGVPFNTIVEEIKMLLERTKSSN